MQGAAKKTAAAEAAAAVAAAASSGNCSIIRQLLLLLLPFCCGHMRVRAYVLTPVTVTAVTMTPLIDRVWRRAFWPKASQTMHCPTCRYYRSKESW